MEKKIIVKSVRVNSSTGYIELDVVAVSQEKKSTMEGPIKTYGTDAHVIQLKYGGDVSLWLEAVKGQHLLHAGHHEELAAQLLEMKGKEL